MCIHIYIYIYIYANRERGREIEIEREIDLGREIDGREGRAPHGVATPILKLHLVTYINLP